MPYGIDLIRNCVAIQSIAYAMIQSTLGVIQYNGVAVDLKGLKLIKTNINCGSAA